MMSEVGKAMSLGVPAPTDAAGNIPKLEARFSVASLGSPSGTVPARIVRVRSGTFECATEEAPPDIVVPLVACLPGCCACSRASRRCSILSFHLHSRGQSKNGNFGSRKAYEASSSSSICKLLLTVQDSPRVLQRAHGEPLVATLHLTL